MKATGIVRNIDALGRVVIPKELRKVLDIKVDDPIEFFTRDNGEIIMKAFNIHCTFCDESDKGKLNEFNHKLVCNKCITKLKK